MRMQIVRGLAVLALLTGFIVQAPTAVAEETRDAAGFQNAPAVVITPAELAALQAREAATPDLADFRAGDDDGVTQIVAWSALGLGTTAFILALIAL